MTAPAVRFGSVLSDLYARHAGLSLAGSLGHKPVNEDGEAFRCFEAKGANRLVMS